MTLTPPRVPPEALPKTPLPFQLGSYVPRADEKFRRWAFVLTARIAEDPAAAGISAETSAQLSAAFKVFNDFYNASLRRSERTADVIGRKNAARRILEEQCRKAAQKIRHDENVPLNVKSAIFRRARLRRAHAASPDSPPALFLAGMRSGRHVLRWWNETDGRRSRPKGVAAMQLFACVGPRAVFDPKRLQYVGTYTKQPMKVEWPGETAGMVVTYVGRWISAKGEEGPWSQPLPIQVAFAGTGLMEIDRAGQVAGMHEYRRAA